MFYLTKVEMNCISMCVESMDNDSYIYSFILLSCFFFFLSSSYKLGFEFGKDLIGSISGLTKPIE